MRDVDEIRLPYSEPERSGSPMFWLREAGSSWTGPAGRISLPVPQGRRSRRPFLFVLGSGSGLGIGDARIKAAGVGLEMNASGWAVLIGGSEIDLDDAREVLPCGFDF